jgi:hypothetical protein
MPKLTPLVTWITPTYCRPETLSNLLACFLAQDYPREHLRLLVLDDADQYSRECRGDSWEIVSIGRRFNSLPAKFNALVGLCETRDESDIIIVAEDDDSFLPWHTSAHVKALADGDYSKPSRVLSDYGCNPGSWITEKADGRFHGSIAFLRTHWAERCGWPLTDQANFDQQMMSHFAAAGRTVDPCEFAPPSYVFRWHTNNYHGQSLADGPGDCEWYRNHELKRFDRTRIYSRQPIFDRYTEALYARIHDLQSMESDAGLAASGGT